MPIRDGLLPEFDQEMANTRKVLDRCPEEKYGWKPHAKSSTMGALATHVANMIGWAVDTMKKDSFDDAPPGAPPYKEDPVTSHKQLMERFDKNTENARAAIDAATDPQFMAPWSLLMAGQTIFTMPRIACVRTMIMNHIIHHRAQLTVYLRLNDVAVPALYGPSADEQN